MGQIMANYGANPQIYQQLRQFGFKEFTIVQYFSVIYKLFQGEHMLVCAPTASGKTLVGEMACLHAILTEKKRCIYLVPLKSLASEKYQNFRRRWGKLGVQVEMSTGDMTLLDREAEEEKLKTANLLIATYERADSILRSHLDWFGGAQVVVVDEVHNVGSAGRGARLEGLIIRLREYHPHLQFIYLSATIGNPGDLADWLKCKLVKHDFRPVPLKYQIRLQANRTEAIKKLVQSTLQQRGSILIFTPTRYEAERLCTDLSFFIKEKALEYLFNTRELRAHVYNLRDEIGGRLDKRLFFSIQRGIAFHHAGLSRVLRGFIERLFRQGLIKVITCTPTLSSGVNLPAKTVVIKDVGLTGAYRTLRVNELHQMCGRAGRPGYDEQGDAIILATQAGEKAEIEVIFFRSKSLIPKFALVESQFMDQANLLEQYLVRIAESPNGIRESELRQLTFQTYWYVTNKRNHPDTTIEHLTRLGHYSLENVLIRHSSRKTLQEARAIPNEAVTIRRMDVGKLEGIVSDRFFIKCSFSKDHPDCACGLFDSKHRYTAPLCRHLVKLARVAYERHPAYVKDMVLSALHEERLVDKLLRFKMVKIRNGRLHATKFGLQAVLLYLRPQTAYWIRQQLPRIWTVEKFYHDLLYAYNMERSYRVKPQYQQVLKHLLEDEYADFDYHVEKLAGEYKIPPGDMEEFVETLRWMIHCFHTLAELDQAGAVLNFTEPAVTRLIPSPIPENRQGGGDGT